VHFANSTDIHADIATDHMRASNVVANTIVRTARKAGVPQQNAHFVAETIRQTIKDASAITTSSDRNPHKNSPAIETTQPTMKTYHNPPIHSPPPLQPHLRTYADVVNNHPQITDDPTTTLTTFLGEFKNLFSQLIHQNSMLLNMLSTMLNKPH